MKWQHTLVFLPEKYLVWRQGSQVSMRVARGNASLLLSHGRGIGIQDAPGKSGLHAHGEGERVMALFPGDLPRLQFLSTFLPPPGNPPSPRLPGTALLVLLCPQGCFSFLRRVPGLSPCPWPLPHDFKYKLYPTYFSSRPLVSPPTYATV